MEFSIKGYGTSTPADFALVDEIEFNINHNGKVSTKVFTKDFLSKILSNSFEVEKFIESGLDHSIDKINI